MRIGYSPAQPRWDKVGVSGGAEGDPYLKSSLVGFGIETFEDVPTYILDSRKRKRPLPTNSLTTQHNCII